MSLFKGMQRGVRFLFLALAGALLIAGCGGGGEGGSSTLTYDGNTSPATIDQGNGQELAGAALDGSVEAGPLLTVSAVQVEESRGSGGGPGIFRLIDAARRMATGLASGTGGQAPTSRSTTSGNGTSSGGCGGTKTVTNFSMNGDQTSFSMTADVRYEDYCDPDETDDTFWTGSSSVSITVSQNGSMSATVSFGPMTVTDGTESVTVEGDVSLSADSMVATTITATLNLKMRDDASRSVFWMENYRVVIDAATKPGYSLVTITGSFYHPVHGRVDITTPAALEFPEGADYPSAGTLRLDGAGGSYVTLEAAPTTFTLTIFDGSTTVTVSGPWTDL